MKKILIITFVILIFSIFFNIYFFIKNNEINNLNVELTKDLKINEAFDSRGITEEQYYDKGIDVKYILTKRDRCLISVFGHPSLSDFGNRQASFYDLLKISSHFGYDCEDLGVENEKSTLEYILMEPILRTKGKPWQFYFEHKGWNGKSAILNFSESFLKDNLDKFSEKDLENLRKVIKKTRDFVIEENPDTEVLYDRLYEILKIKK